MADEQRPSDRRPSEDEDRRQAREWSRYSNLAIELLAYLGVLGYGGWWLDQKYGWNGRGLMSGLILGLVAWIYRVLKTTRHLFK